MKKLATLVLSASILATTANADIIKVVGEKELFSLGSGYNPIIKNLPTGKNHQDNDILPNNCVYGSASIDRNLMGVPGLVNANLQASNEGSVSGYDISYGARTMDPSDAIEVELGKLIDVTPANEKLFVLGDKDFTLKKSFNADVSFQQIVKQGTSSFGLSSLAAINVAKSLSESKSNKVFHLNLSYTRKRPTFRNFQIKPYFLNMLERGEFVDFYKKCGLDYIAGIVEGYVMDIVVVMKESKTSSKKLFKGKAKADLTKLAAQYAALNDVIQALTVPDSDKEALLELKVELERQVSKASQSHELDVYISLNGSALGNNGSTELFGHGEFSSNLGKDISFDSNGIASMNGANLSALFTQNTTRFLDFARRKSKEEEFYVHPIVEVETESYNTIPMAKLSDVKFLPIEFKKRIIENYFIFSIHSERVQSGKLDKTKIDPKDLITDLKSIVPNEIREVLELPEATDDERNEKHLKLNEVIEYKLGYMKNQLTPTIAFEKFDDLMRNFALDSKKVMDLSQQTEVLFSIPKINRRRKGKQLRQMKRFLHNQQQRLKGINHYCTKSSRTFTSCWALRKGTDVSEHLHLWTGVVDLEKIEKQKMFSRNMECQMNNTVAATDDCLTRLAQGRRCKKIVEFTYSQEKKKCKAKRYLPFTPERQKLKVDPILHEVFGQEL